MIFASIFDGSIRYVSISGSTKTGMSPFSEIAKIEAIERYCAYTTPRTKVIFDVGSSLRANTDVTCYPNCDMDQRQFWVLAMDEREVNKLWIPLDYVKLGETTIRSSQSTTVDSTGFAAHFDESVAMENGIREVVERAALRKCWENGLVYFWEKTNMPCSARLLIDYLESQGYIVKCVPLCSYERFNSCLSVVFFKKTQQAFSWGASADECIEKALYRCLLEVYAKVVTFEAQSPSNQAKLLASTGKATAELESKFISCTSPIAFGKGQDNLLPNHKLSPIYKLDRGNTFSDCLSLSVIQVVIPNLYSHEIDKGSSTDATFPFV